MTVRVRFAPSPTGYLHIGGARTALYNYLFAKKMNGKFILRIEDTDLERSRPEFEKSQLEDLKWLGLTWDEGPDKGGDYGPYRQSERISIYKEYAEKLIDKGLAYYCFCTSEELEAMKEKATREGRLPHYEGKWKNEEFWEEARQRLASGEKASIRFKAPFKSYVLQDEVRGRVVFPEGMVGDFVLIRSTGLPVYNYCCVVDDMLMKITHVIRGEDHLSNTLRQLMIYEAFGSSLPVFAHVSLLIGKDRQKLSKRHGATSVSLYREESYLPQALANYLLQLGWSHPEEKDIFSLDEVSQIFDISRFSKAAAIYDLDKLKWVNGQHLRKQDIQTLVEQAKKVLPENHPFLAMNSNWQERCLSLFKDQVNFLSELEGVLDENVFTDKINDSEKLQEILSWDSTQIIKTKLKEFILTIDADSLSSEVVEEWMSYFKSQNIKGKNLFMGFRACLTGKDHGPELKDLIPLTPLEIVKKRILSL